MNLTPEEIKIVEAFRRIRERQFGDLEISVSNGRLVKLFEVVKHSVLIHTLKEVAQK